MRDDKKKGRGLSGQEWGREWEGEEELRGPGLGVAKGCSQ